MKFSNNYLVFFLTKYLSADLLRLLTNWFLPSLHALATGPFSFFAFKKAAIKANVSGIVFIL